MADELQRQLTALLSQNEALQEQIRENQTNRTITQTPTREPEVYRVAVRLPPFWADKPAVWFAQAEAQFTVSNITVDNTKYSYIVSQLDSRYAAEVEDILANPPTDNKYEYLKLELIRRLSLSEEQKVRQLISEEELGDRKPSQFLRHLRSLAGTTTLQDNLLRQLWLRRLPAHVQAILTAQSEISIEKVAELADKILEISPASISTTAVHSVAHPNDNSSTLSGRIEQLTNQVAALSKIVRQPHVKRNRSRSRCKTGNQNNNNGKPEEQPLVAASGCSSSGSRLFITDQNCKYRFLIDTGSDVCCFPRRYLRKSRQVSDLTLNAANNTGIRTYGFLPLSLNLGLRREFNWRFVIADVGLPIIGADFLAHYHLLPDCRSGRLLDASTGLYSRGQVMITEHGNIKVVSGTSPYATLLAEFPDLTRPPGIPREIKHQTVHFIRTTDGPPVFCRPRRLAPCKLSIAKAEFDEMIRVGTARPSKSAWSSPLHLAPKRDNSWRPCGDYRALNARTIPDRYPVRNITDFTHNLAGCIIFSTIDLVKAYQQIPVHPDDVCKTAISTPFGLFEFPFMTFGLRNAGQTFQRFMDEVTRGLDFCFTYIDDILVSSHSIEEHINHLRILFQRLVSYGVVINPTKCTLGVPEVTFLGYRVSASGTYPPAERISALREYPLPKTVQGLRRFIGMINFYRRFCPHAAELQAPLHNALANSKLKGKQPMPWTAELEAAFVACKESLSNATLIVHPKLDAFLGLFTDASLVAVGACLQQRVNNSWQPLAFFSKKLSPKQATWPPYHRELLAIHEAVKHFRHILEGQHFRIYTDHKPIVFAFKQRHEKIPPIQLNQLSFISQFTTDIEHISGADNVVSDCLSRIEVITKPLNMQDLANSQIDDEELQGYLNPDSSLKLERIPVPGSTTSLYCDSSTGHPRPYVTAPFRRRVFESLHQLSHPGTRATIKLVSSRYVWPSMKRDCRNWAQTCLSCQRSKVTRHIKAPLGHFMTPSARFNHVHVDIVGPLPPSSNYRYLLTAVDRVTRWPEVILLQDITAESVTWAFLYGWVARFGVPQHVTCDQGRQFESSLFKDVMSMCGIRKCRTTAYHPQASGMVERFHRSLKAALMCHEDESWITALPWVLLGLRTALKEDVNASTAELLYGEVLRLPGELVGPAKLPSRNDISNLLSRLRLHATKIRPVPASRHARPGTFIFREMASSSHAFLRDDTVRGALQPPYSGPHEIIDRDTKTLVLRLRGKPVRVSIDRVKPAHMEANSSHDVEKSTSTETKSSDESRRTRSGRSVRFPDFFVAG